MAVRLDEAAMEDMLHSEDGLVGRYIRGLGIQAAAIAKALAPERKARNMSWSQSKSTSYPSVKWPGQLLKSSVHAAFGYSKTGQMYGGVNAAYGPTLFLTKPAEQIHTGRSLFMTDALDSVAL